MADRLVSVDDEYDLPAPVRDRLADTLVDPAVASKVDGTDPRLSDARTPTAHADTHAAAGSDPVTLTIAQTTGLQGALDAKAPLASPALTGTPTVPTPPAGDNSGRIANTAFVRGAVDNATSAPFDTFATGNYYTSPTGDAGNLALTQNRMLAAPLDVPEALTVDRLGLRVATAGGAGSVVRLGIYDANAAGSPGDLVLDAGTIDGTTTGFLEITVSQALTAARYFLVAVAQVGSAPVVGSNSGIAVQLGAMDGTRLAQYRVSGYEEIGAATSGALPATFPAFRTTVSSARAIARIA